MAQVVIVRTHGKVGVFTWTEGFKESPAPQPKTEDDFLALALWLERQGRTDEALAFLELRLR